jgi:hypothetical protein
MLLNRRLGGRCVRRDGAVARLAAPMSGGPDPGAVSHMPPTWNPDRVRIGARGVTPRHPHPTPTGPVPETGCPYHRRPRRRRRDGLGLRRGRRHRRGGARSRVRRVLSRGILSRRVLSGGVLTRGVLSRRILSRRGQRRYHEHHQSWHAAAPAQGIAYGAGRRGSRLHRNERILSSSINLGSCRVVSCPRTGLAIASSRLCAPFHSDAGRT